MGFKVNTNIDALKAYYQLARTNATTAKAQLRLASGMRINSVADDTSGFNVGTSLKGKVAVMKGAQSNISSAKNLLSTAEGSLLGINDLLVKIDGKLSDAQNPTNDRTSLQNDIRALANEISSTLSNTKFNNTKLLNDSTANSGFIFQVGESTDTLKLDFASSLASSGSGTSTNVAASLSSFVNVSAATLESTGSGSGTGTIGSLQVALASLKSAVSDSLGKIGNFTQRLDVKESTMNVAITNAQSSISRLFDADMAKEQLNATRGSIIAQAGTAMLAQLNSSPQQVLQLFR